MDFSQVGPQFQTDGTYTQDIVRKGRDNALVVTEAHGQQHEAASRGFIYSAANQAAVALTAGLATTYTGLCLINPITSTKNLSLLEVGVGASAAFSALTTLGLLGGWASTGLTAFTAIATTLWGNNNVGLTNASVASVAAAGVTLVGTPRYLKQFGSGFTTQSLDLFGVIAINGNIVVPPGGYVAVSSIAAFTAAGWFSFTWEEVPI